MFRASLNLVKNLGRPNLWYAPNFKYISIQQPTPMITPAKIINEEDVSINEEQDLLNKYWHIRQEIHIIGQPIMECKHKPKERARRKRSRRRNGAKTNARWR